MASKWYSTQIVGTIPRKVIVLLTSTGGGGMNRNGTLIVRDRLTTSLRV
jgi:hypothetical protein